MDLVVHEEDDLDENNLISQMFIGTYEWGVEWLTMDIEVLIKDTHEDDRLEGQTGIIQGIQVSNFSLFFLYVTV